MAKRPTPAAQRVSLVRAARPGPTPEQAAEREQRRHERVLHGGPMRMVVEAIIASGSPVEIETETHIVTITAVEK